MKLFEKMFGKKNTQKMWIYVGDGKYKCADCLTEYNFGVIGKAHVNYCPNCGNKIETVTSSD